MERKWVHFLFAIAGLVAFLLLKETGLWIWSYFGKPKPLYVYPAAFVVTAIAVYVTWRSEEIFTLASECVTELMKVSWPTRRETGMATLVVIVTVVFSSIILGIYDAVWASLTRMLYG